MSGTTMSSKSMVRVHQHPPSTPLLDPSFLMVTHPYISAEKKDNDTKLSAYDPFNIPSTSITSMMTLSKKYPVRNHQHPPSIPILDNSFLTPFYFTYQRKTFSVCFFRSYKFIHDIKDDPVLQVSSQESSVSSK